MSAVRVSEERLELDGEPLPYLLRRDPRRKRLALLVTREATVEVRVPTRASKRDIDRFLGAHRGWLRERLAHARRARLPLADGARLPYLDGVLALEARPRTRAGSGRARRADGRLRVDYLPEDDGALVAVLERWYRRRAAEHLKGRVALFAERMGLAPSGITIRGQRTRWGSCSSRGTLSLNWRLMFAPAAAVDYVVIHELAHLRHMDHSPAFWQLVERFDPDYRRHRRLLRMVNPPF